MSIRLYNSKNRFGIISILFHWSMAFLIILMLILGFYMANLPKGPELSNLVKTHKSIGVLILLLVLLRLIWRVNNLTPVLNIPLWEKVAEQGVHWVLYLLIFAMPITGWLMSSAAGNSPAFFGLFVLPNLVSPNKSLVHTFFEMHETLAFCLVAFIIFHTIAALKHHFYDKDDILIRMFSSQD